MSARWFIRFLTRLTFSRVLMTTIQTGTGLLTLINVFHVQPHNQDALVAVLVDATDQAMRHQPGFVSANIHRSADGRRVVNYAQWRSQEDFDAMQSSGDARPHMMEAAKLAESYDPIICEVVEAASASDEAAS